MQSIVNPLLSPPGRGGGLIYFKYAKGGGLNRDGGRLIESRPWRIVLLKVAYYATSSARNFAKLC